MKNLSLSVVLLSSAISSQAVAQVQSTSSSVVLLPLDKGNAVPATLPVSSEVWLNLDNDIDSRNYRVGDKFIVTVVYDVMVGNTVVIPHGAHGHGQITYRTGKGIFGKSGKLEFDITDIVMEDHTIPLSGHYRIAGDGNTGATLATIVWFGLPAGTVVTGHSAVGWSGTVFRATTTMPVQLGTPTTIVAQAPKQDAPASATPQAVVANLAD
jgi:hypothetical protein